MFVLLIGKENRIKLDLFVAMRLSIAILKVKNM